MTMHDAPRPVPTVTEPSLVRPPERLKPLFRDPRDPMTPERAADVIPMLMMEARNAIELKDMFGTARWCAEELHALASLMHQWAIAWEVERRNERQEAATPKT